MSHIVRSERTCRLPACLLVRKRSALADPYCQSAWNSACLWVCLSATLRSNISKTKGARRKVTMGSL